MQKVNHIVETIDISNESVQVEEPVTLYDMKNYLKTEGFIDDNDSSPVEDPTQDDFEIMDFITGARQELEEVLGISIVPHTWRAVGVTNQAGNIRLENGPNISITSITNSDGDAYDHEDDDKVRLTGDRLEYPNDDRMTIEYEAGYTTVPKTIIKEIKRMVAYYYEHRGDEDKIEPYKYTAGVMAYSKKQLFH